MTPRAASRCHVGTGQGLKEAARIGHHNASQNWTDATVLTISLESSRGSRERECTYSMYQDEDGQLVLEAMQYNPVTVLTANCMQVRILILTVSYHQS